MDNAIFISGLRKSFGKTQALDGLDLRVNTGEVHGFLGPNGAGKSTTVRVLLGLIRADAGDIRLLGGDPWKDAAQLHRRLAYVPGDVNLWPNLSGGEVIDLLGRLRGGVDQQKRNDLIEKFELDPAKKGRAYSKGNRQKVAIVAALSSNVDLLILDEPTSGLDPLMESTFQNAIQEERKQGRTVLLSSHILAEVEALCDRVSIIRDGKNVETGTLSELRHLKRTSIVADLNVPENELETRLAPLSTSDQIHDLKISGSQVRFSVEENALGEALKQLTNIGVRGLVSQPPTLEELFLRHYTTKNSEDLDGNPATHDISAALR
jgi:ABC-2 type transport system ATP-binding protein